MGSGAWGLVVSVCIVALSGSVSVKGRPATFEQDFRIAWADNHVKQIEGGRAIQLTLDQSSGRLSSISIPTLIISIIYISLLQAAGLLPNTNICLDV